MLRRLLNYDGNLQIVFNLFEAAYGGLAIVVNTLVDRDADVNEQDAYGWTPLMYAAYAGHTEVVKVLLEAGAETNLRSKFGKTAYDWALQAEHFEIATLLRPSNVK